MKKMMLLAALFTFLCKTGVAQSNVRFGFTTSPEITWMSPDNKKHSSDGARFGFNYGAIVDFIIGENDRYAISTGLTINMLGGKIIGRDSLLTDDGGGQGRYASVLATYVPVSSSLTAKLQYLEIPVALKLRSNETASNLTFYGMLGLVPGFLIRSRAQYEYANPVSGEAFSEENIKIRDLKFYPNTIERIVPVNLSMQFEGGVEYRVGDNTAIVGGLYFRNGFMNMVADSDNERIVGRQMGLRIGVMF